MDCPGELYFLCVLKRAMGGSFRCHDWWWNWVGKLGYIGRYEGGFYGAVSERRLFGFSKDSILFSGGKFWRCGMYLRDFLSFALVGGGGYSLFFRNGDLSSGCVRYWRILVSGGRRFLPL